MMLAAVARGMRMSRCVPVYSVNHVLLRLLSILNVVGVLHKHPVDANDKS